MGQTIKDLTKINFHDARVKSIQVNGDVVELVMPDGIVDDFNEFNIPRCSLRVVMADLPEVWLSKRTHRILKKRILYLTEKMYSFDKLCKKMSKGRYFEILNWTFKPNFIDLDCVFIDKGNYKREDPLRISICYTDIELKVM